MWDLCDFFLLRIGVIFVSCVVFFRVFCVIIFGSLLVVIVGNKVWVEDFILVNWFVGDRFLISCLVFLLLCKGFEIRFFLVVGGDGE